MSRRRKSKDDPTKEFPAFLRDEPYMAAARTRWYCPTKMIQIDDRTWGFRLQPPVQLGYADAINAEFGLGWRILQNLADAGLISCVRPTPNTRMYYFAEVAEYLKTSSDERFWTIQRRRAYEASAQKNRLITQP